MKTITLGLALSAATLLSACGGGGGTTPTASTALASNAVPAAATFTSFRTVNPSAQLLSAAVDFSHSDTNPVYVAAWYIDDQDVRQQLIFTRLVTLQATRDSMSVQLPADVKSIQFEIYDAATSKKGEIPS